MKRHDEPEFDFGDLPEDDSFKDMVRRSDPETSWEAAETAHKDKTRSQRECKAHIVDMLTTGYLNGNLDFTQKEFRQYLIEEKGLTPSRSDSLRRRFTDLERRGDINTTGDKRDKAQLYRLNPHMP